MVDIQTVSAVAAAMSVAIGAVIGVIQFRNLVKTRQAQFFLNLYNKFSEKDVLTMYIEVLFLWKWEDFHDFLEKYGPEKNLDEFMKWVIVTTHLENMGLIAHEKMVDIHFVSNLIGSAIQDFWEKYEPILIEWKKKYKTPKIMPMTEYLYEQIKTIRPREIATQSISKKES
jgi:hypothetical protein